MTAIDAPPDRENAGDSIDGSRPSLLPSLRALIILTIGFRLTEFVLVRYGSAAPEFSDFLYYHDLARLSAQGYWPEIQFWTEYPPIFPWLAVAAYRLTLGWPPWIQSNFWFDLIITLVLAVADAGSLVALDRIGNAVWGKGGGRRSAVLYAGLFAPAYAVLGWFDTLPTFFLLAALAVTIAPPGYRSRWLAGRAESVTPGRWLAVGLLAGVGAMTKLFPVVVLPATLVAASPFSETRPDEATVPRPRPAAIALALAGVGAALAVGAIAAPFLLTSPATFLATFRNVLARGSWESPWALLDGYYGSGGVAMLADRLFFNGSAAWGETARDPAIWWIVLAIAAALYLFRLRDAMRHPSPRAAVAVTGLGVTFLLLLSRGFSQQFIVWILPFVVLLMPGLDGVVLAVLLSADTLLLEGYLFVTIFPTLHGLLWASVAIRTALLGWFAVECAAAVDPAQWSRYRSARRRLDAPVALIAAAAVALGVALISPAVLAEARATFGNPALAAALGSLPPSSAVVFTQPAAYDRLSSAIGDHPAVVVAEPRLLTWTGDRSLNRRLEQALASPADVVVLTDASLPASGPLLDGVSRWLSNRFGPPATREIGSLRLDSYDAARTVKIQVLDVTFGDRLKLTGVSPDQLSVRAGAPLTLTLHWTSTATITGDFSVSTQILDHAGHLLAQHDSMPVDNTMPTSSWNPGETIDDSISLAIPASAVPGQYPIIVAVYDPKTLVRLAAGGPNGQGDHGIIGNVMIER